VGLKFQAIADHSIVEGCRHMGGWAANSKQWQTIASFRVLVTWADGPQIPVAANDSIVEGFGHMGRAETGCAGV
jgi:hypothetical protein